MLDGNYRTMSTMVDHIRVFLLIITLLCAAFTIGQSQTKEALQGELVNYYPKKLISSVELMAGPSFVYGRGSELFNEYRIFKAGFSGGLGLIKSVNSKFSIQMNFMFEIKGYKQSLNGINMDSGYARPAKLKDEMTLKYFTASLLPKYNFTRGRLSFGLGPYFGYLNGYKHQQENYVNGALTISYTQKRFPYEVFKKYDYGITTIVGTNFNNDRSLWSINVLYSLGLVDINQPTITGLKRNNTYTLLLTYKIITNE